MKNCVYRFINVDDEIIYIGKAKNLESRLNNHKHLPEGCYNEMAYIEFTSFSNEHEMDFAERYYIQKLSPKYNTQLASRIISFTSTELDNKEFKVYLVNEKVIEQCKYQMEKIKSEVDNTGVIRRVCNYSIYDVTSYIFMKYNSEYRNYDKKKSTCT